MKTTVTVTRQPRAAPALTAHYSDSDEEEAGSSSGNFFSLDGSTSKPVHTAPDYTTAPMVPPTDAPLQFGSSSAPSQQASTSTALPTAASMYRVTDDYPQEDNTCLDPSLYEDPPEEQGSTDPVRSLLQDEQVGYG